MSVTKMVDAQLKAFAEIEKRFDAKPSQASLAKLGEAALEIHAGRIDARIAQLEKQKAVTVARIDEEIAREREALASIRRERPDLPFEKVVGEGKSPKLEPAKAKQPAASARSKSEADEAPAGKAAKKAE